MTVSSTPRLAGAVVALRVPEFRRFFAAAIVSNSGAWLQAVSTPWVMFELTGSGSWVGAAVFASLIPMAVAAPVAGPLADRVPRRDILRATQATMGVLALALAVMWSSGVRRPAAYLVVLVASGTVNGFNMPAWQAFVADLVPRDLLMNAVTLNSTQFNAARAIGPSLGGVVLAVSGPAAAFAINGVSFFAVFCTLFTLPSRAPTPPEDSGTSLAAQFAAGWSVVFASRPIRAAFLAAGFLAAFGGPLIQVHLVLFAEQIFEVSEWRFGLLVAAFGSGAITLAPVLAAVGPKVRPHLLLLGAMTTYGLGELLLASTGWYAVGLIGVLIAGASHLTVATTANSVIQLSVDATVRGRVLALYLMVITVVMPLSALIQGRLADAVGSQAVVTTTGFGLLVGAALLLGPGGARSIRRDPPSALSE